jgi:hypothetical protein
MQVTKREIKHMLADVRKLSVDTNACITGNEWQEAYTQAQQLAASAAELESLIYTKLRGI